MDVSSAAAAQRTFYAAFEAIDVTRMMRVWADVPTATCVHPLGVPLVGLAAIQASWAGIFTNAGRRAFEVVPVAEWIGPDLALFTVYETVIDTTTGYRFPAIVATNAFRRFGDEWLMILHHASPQRVEPPEAEAPVTETRH